jgi:hypothetical protein
MMSLCSVWIGKYEGNIFFIPVSKSPNLKVIVQKLFHHKNEQVPHEFPSDEDAINQLKQLVNGMKQKPILLILDDVWSGSESLLEKFAFDVPNYKILATSRTEFRRFPTYKLKLLKGEAAMKLFRHSAILNDGSSYIPSEDIVKEVLSQSLIYIYIYIYISCFCILMHAFRRYFKYIYIYI